MKITSKITNPIPVSQPPPNFESVMIELTPEEAKTLYAVCNKIGGSCGGTRGYTDRLRVKLEAFTDSFKSAKVDLTTSSNNNAIYFTP